VVAISPQQTGDRSKHVTCLGGTVDLDHIFEFAELANQLLEPVIVIYGQQDHAAHAVVDGKAENALDIEGTPGKKATHVRHHAGVIADEQS
jgi:hypothetical protein